MPFVGEPRPTTSRTCPKCGGKRVTYRKWESSDGGHEDDNFTCDECHHEWWIDGIDS